MDPFGNEPDSAGAGMVFFDIEDEGVVAASHIAGFQEGTLMGRSEGFVLGLAKGQQIGAELGYMAGIARMHLASMSKTGSVATSVAADAEGDVPEDAMRTAKVKALARAIIDGVEAFPLHNENKGEHTGFDIVAELDSLRAKFKLMLGILKKQSLMKMTSPSAGASTSIGDF